MPTKQNKVRRTPAIDSVKFTTGRNVNQKTKKRTKEKDIHGQLNKYIVTHKDVRNGGASVISAASVRRLNIEAVHAASVATKARYGTHLARH